jgi:hypothetical protein
MRIFMVMKYSTRGTLNSIHYGYINRTSAKYFSSENRKKAFG